MRKVRDGLVTFKGLNIDSIAGSVFFHSLRILSLPVTLEQVSKLTQIDKSELESTLLKVTIYCDRPDIQKQEISLCRKFGYDLKLPNEVICMAE